MPRAPKTPFEKLTKGFNYQNVYQALEIRSTKDNPHHSQSLRCDDGQGLLSVTLAVDSDVHASVTALPSSDFEFMPSFRCRTYAGGGRNEKTRMALLILMLAMKEDAAQYHQPPDRQSKGAVT